MEIKLIGKTDQNSLEERIKMVAAAGKLSRFKGNVYEVLESCNDYQKNLNLIERIIKMGHKSIIEHDYLVFALVDVTPIIEQIIIGYRLTSFTIKSRREVDFSNVGFYTPDFRNIEGNIHPNNKELQDKYKNHMNYLFKEYSKLVDLGINKEDSRFVLPYSYHSNIIMGLDARELERMVIDFLYGKVSEIAELKELGNKFLKIIEKSVPYLYETIINYDQKEETDLNNYETDVEIANIPKPLLISSTQNVDKQIAITYLMGKYQCDNTKAGKILDILIDNNPHALKEIINYVAKKRDNRELEYVDFQFQIPISLAVLTHLTRHRMHSLIVPSFVPMWDLKRYMTPESIKNKWEAEYKEIYRINLEMYNYFKKQNIKEEDLVYFYLSGNMCNVITSMNGRTAKWICHMRCCTKAQWEIRNIANNIVKEIKNVAPIFGENLGPTCITDNYCPEGTESCGLINKIKVRN